MPTPPPRAGAALAELVAAWLTRDDDDAPRRGPLLVGVQGIQGCGKSTLCERLARASPPRCAAVSLDDFYLPDAALDHAHPDARLRGRGNPGTHDVAALASALAALRAGGVAEVPVYDKEAHGGRGDRAPRTRRLDGAALDVVLLEGWCVGFRARGRADDAVDAALAAYEPAFALLDRLVVLHAPAPRAHLWRAQAERALDADGVRALVDRFMPAYRTYLPALRARRDPAILHVRLDAARAPLAHWTRDRDGGAP